MVPLLKVREAPQEPVSAQRILFSAGDDSGDLHAANLMRAMRRLRPELEFVGFGMEGMREAGLHPLAEDRGSAMWLRNLLHLGHLRRRLHLCRTALRRGELDLVVPVDYGGFNMYLCREATRQGVPVCYFIPPQVWAHGRYRLKKLRKWTDRAALIYPFEPALYEQYGVEARYVGHPLFDQIEQRPPSPQVVSALRDRFGHRLVGVFPGSREQEIEAHLPLIVETCRRVGARIRAVQFALLCPRKLRPQLASMLTECGIGVAMLEEVQPIELARAAYACITKSGTITLEIASQGTPMVIFYRPSPIVYFLACGLADTPYFGVVNALAGREICPEKAIVAEDADWLTDQTLALLGDPEAYARCREGILEMMEGFARPGACQRAAEYALEML